MGDLSAEDLQALLSRAQSDLIFHIEEVQGVESVEEHQRQICEAVIKYQRVAISACHDVGKTWTMSKIVLALGSSFPGAKIITTAPNATLVEKLLWSEIRNGHRISKYPLGGRMLTTQWQIREDWFAIGLSPKEEASGGSGQGTASNFQGFHGTLVVIIFDEATGVPPLRWIQAEGMMTSANVKWICIGNPTSATSEFAKCFKSASWHKIRLSCFDSPNLQANGICNLEDLKAEIDRVREMSETDRLAHIKSYKIVRPYLLTLQWVIDRALAWGIEHPLFQSKVLGVEPTEDDHVLMPLAIVEAAQARERLPDDGGRISVGVDVARFGSDKTVITGLRAANHFKTKVLVKRDTTEIVGAVIDFVKDLGSNVTIAVDSTGLGAGVIDGLREAKREKRLHHNVLIIEVNFGEGFDHIHSESQREEARRMFANRKAKIFWRLAQDLKESLCLAQDGVYSEELPTVIYKFDSKGRIVIESKEEYQKRTQRPSPDHADSLAIANEARYFTAIESEMPVPKGKTITKSLQGKDAW